MDVLFVSALFPYPLASGGHVRIFQLLKKLSAKHNITLACFTRNNEAEIYSNKLNFCKEIISVHRGSVWQLQYILNALFGRFPILLTSYDNKIMYTKIRNILSSRSIDLIHLEPFYVWPSVPKTDLPIVIAEHNIEFLIYQTYAQTSNIPVKKQILGYDVKKLEFYEKKIWRKATAISVVSKQDYRFIKSYSSKSLVREIPNSIDHEQFKYKEHKIEANLLRFLFVGDYNWIQNCDAVSFLLIDIWPLIRSKFKTAELHLIGKNLPTKLVNLARKQKVKYMGFVEDISYIYHNHDVLLSPIRIGGGTKYKIIEALACGLPVIATSKASEGFDDEIKKVLLIADDPSEYIKKTEYLIKQIFKINIMIRNARKLIEKKYSWDTTAVALENLWIESTKIHITS